jgi:hypothetical protein
MKLLFFAAALLFVTVSGAKAQDQATVVASCGTAHLTAGTQAFRTVDVNGVTCSGAGSSGSTGHRYWQIYMTANGAGAVYAIAEVQFRTTAGTPLLFSGGTASATSFYAAGYEADKAADNNPATFWNSDTTLEKLSNNAWIYDYGVGKALSIVEITIQARPDTFFSQSPTVFTPKWSDDGVTWTSKNPITTATWTASSQIQTFAVTP